jgi:hypothetical protein
MPLIVLVIGMGLAYGFSAGALLAGYVPRWPGDPRYFTVNEFPPDVFLFACLAAPSGAAGAFALLVFEVHRRQP